MLYYEDKMAIPDIEIYMDCVILEKVRINRPSRMSVGQWLYYWERTRDAWVRWSRGVYYGN
jgi:hypothetical protein